MDEKTLVEDKWGHWNCELDCIPEEAIGFVYKIIDNTTGEFYIGLKNIVKKLTRPPLKGKKRKRRSLVESDWKTYCSSGSRAEDILENKENYTFEILSFHNSKSDLKIEETRLIIEHVYEKQCLNQMVNLRVRIYDKQKI